MNRFFHSSVFVSFVFFKKKEIFFLAFFLPCFVNFFQESAVVDFSMALEIFYKSETQLYP